MKNICSSDSFFAFLSPVHPGHFRNRCSALILLLLLLTAQSAMAVTAGRYHTLAINSDGSLWAWGRNSEGQLGDGSYFASYLPKQVSSGFSAVAAGYKHTLALKPDHTLWAWGSNAFGQLGDGTTTDRNIPLSIGSGFSSVAAGEQHTVALKSDGSLWAWGYNANGQLGDGTTTQRLSPQRIGTDSNFVSIAAGYQHTLALKNDGTLWAWGYNSSGQLGDGSSTRRTSPVQVGAGFTSIAAGQSHSLALKADGTLWAWGSDGLGQLGNGTATTTAQNLPLQVGTGFALVAAGAAHTVALKTDGTLWAWGYNKDYGQLGDGSLVNQSSPIQIASGVTSLAAGDSHTLVFKSDGSLWAWGDDVIGQLGDGTSGAGNKQSSPVQIALATGFADNQAPTVPGGLTATASGSAQINLAWTASSDSVGVASYKLYRDGILAAILGNVTETGVAGLQESTPYSFALAACDEANNCSSQTASVTATTTKASAALSKIELSCPLSITSGTSGICTVTATYADETTKVVTSTLSSSDTSALNVSASDLTAGNVAADTAVTVTATYTENGIAKTATASVTVNAPIVTPSGTVTPITKPEDVISNPGTGVSVDTTGALVVTDQDPTKPIVISSAAPENALVKLETLAPVSFTSGTTTLQYTDQVGAAQLVIRTVNNQPQLEVAKGTVEIAAPAANITISVVSSNQATVGSIVTQTTADKVVVEKTDTTSAVFVDSGRVNYQGPGVTAAIPVYQGENTQLDTTGALNQLALGSLGGKKQVPGDPLPLTAIPRDTATKVPNLEGTLPRFNNTVTLQDLLRDMIKGLMEDTAGIGQMTYDKSTGVITYVVGSTTYRLIALGDVLVQLNQFSATNVAATAGGAYTLASRGIQMSLSGALGYFSDLQSAVKSADAAGTLNLKPTGAIEIRLGGARYAVMPGSSASVPSNPTLSIGFDTNGGNLVFRDHLGTLQTLYPAFLDVDTVTSIFKTAIPSIVLTNKADGTVTAGLGGQNYTLRPDYLIVDQSAAGHAAESFWLESGVIFLRNADMSAQGTRVQ
ncbi:MAG: hypothetical protein WCV99_12330 [Sterolibacterium sp.]|jgi:alpha-tubulin suppressor-like RCC1 family protein